MKPGTQKKPAVSKREISTDTGGNTRPFGAGWLRRGTKLIKKLPKPEKLPPYPG